MSMQVNTFAVNYRVSLTMFWFFFLVVICLLVIWNFYIKCFRFFYLEISVSSFFLLKIFPTNFDIIKKYSEFFSLFFILFIFFIFRAVHLWNLCKRIGRCFTVFLYRWVRWCVFLWGLYQMSPINLKSLNFQLMWVHLVKVYTVILQLNVFFRFFSINVPLE